MSQSGKSLLYSHENLSSYPPKLYINLNVVECPGTGKADRRIRGPFCPTSLVKFLSSRFSERLHLKTKQKAVV